MAMAKSEAELKQAGAFEAARDPNSAVTAADAQAKALTESKKAGAQAFSFNPNASPEQKAAQAEANIPDGFHRESKPVGVAVATDIDDGRPGAYDLPSPTKAGAIPIAKDKDGKPLPKGADSLIAGEEKDHWAERTGWAPRFGNGPPVDPSESMLDHQTWVEGKLGDHLYGDWYHNTGVIIFACLASWFVAVLGGGLAWIFIVMATCGTYYRTSIRRVRRNVRDDVNREMAKATLETEVESLEWINVFLGKFWPIYAPVIAETVIKSVDQVLSTSTPAFLDSMRMSFFTLGSKPPRMEHVKSYPKAADDTVLMDWKFSFTPNDTADMTERQIKNKINPKVILEIRIGKAMISTAMPIIVEDFSFSGLMRVKVKLQIPFPHVERVEICFLGRPTIDYKCKPIGGDMLGFDINFIPGLESFIMEQIHANLAPIMYDPNVFPIEVAKMLSGSPVDQAIGVVAVTLHYARGLKNADKLSGTPDPYVVVSLNGREALAQTKIIKENANPVWNETKYIIVTSLKDTLTLQLYDYNEFRKAKELGTATFALDKLETQADYENQELEVMSNGKARGLVSADVRFFPVLASKKGPDGKLEPAPESNTGIARFLVEQAKDLDGTKSLVGQLNPYAILLLNNREIHTSKKLKRTNNPVWDNAYKEILITDRKTAKLGLVVKDDRGLAGDPIVGTYQIKLNDMLELTEKGQEWYSLAGVTTGRAKMSIQWKPVALSAGAGTGGYITPIGVMRLHVKNARDIRNVETMGKSDPYVRALLSGIEKGRTVTFQNNLNPDFDEVIYVPVHNEREKITLEVMDQENLQKDRSLGEVQILAGDYIKQADSGEYLVNDKKAPIASGLLMGGKGSAKGTLNYTVSFYPCLNIVDPEEEEEKEKEKAEEASLKPASPTDKLSPLGSHPSEKKDAIQLQNEKAKAATKIDPSLAKKLAEGEKEQKEQDELAGEHVAPKIRLTPEELIKYESGLIIFKLHEADLSYTNVKLEILVDDMAFPSYTSSTIRSRKMTLDEVGDCFVRELDFSKLTLRLREKGDRADGKKDNDVAKLTGNTIDTLRQCLYKPTVLKMRDEQGQVNNVTVSLKYIPVKMDLDPSESINNMGTLRVDVLDGKDLPSADRNGYSDPFCKFDLNGETIFKTQVQKKTLQPVWNENFETQISSRTAAKLLCKAYDWDFASEPDKLGTGTVDLSVLEPFRPKDYIVALDGKSGVIRLRLLFKPAYITRTRQGTSTFSGTFSAPTKIVTGVASAPIKGVGLAAAGVGKGASFITKGFKKGSDGATNGSVGSIAKEDIPVPSREMAPIVAAAPVALAAPKLTSSENAANTPESPNSKAKSISAGSQYSGATAGVNGTANFNVISATGYPPAAHLMVFVKQVSSKKTVFKSKHVKSPSGNVKFDESFKCPATSDSQYQLVVKDHNTFGSDDELGESLFTVDDTGSGEGKSIKVGTGAVIVKSWFVAAENGIDGGSVRKGFLNRKENGRTSRDITPAP